MARTARGPARRTESVAGCACALSAVHQLSCRQRKRCAGVFRARRGVHVTCPSEAFCHQRSQFSKVNREKVWNVVPEARTCKKKPMLSPLTTAAVTRRQWRRISLCAQRLVQPQVHSRCVHSICTFVCRRAPPNMAHCTIKGAVGNQMFAVHPRTQYVRYISLLRARGQTAASHDRQSEHLLLVLGHCASCQDRLHSERASDTNTYVH